MSIGIAEKPVVHTDLSVELLVEMAQQGNENVTALLIKKYNHLVRSKAYKYYLTGGDKEDIMQEGLIGLYKAILDFKRERTSSFKSFAELCITRQIITAIKMATRQKHSPLNSSISLDKPINKEDPDHTMMDVISEITTTDPVVLLIDQEEGKAMESMLLEILSPLERDVLALYLEGLSYIEITKRLNVHMKSIDNALQRVKRKIEKHINE